MLALNCKAEIDFPHHFPLTYTTSHDISLKYLPFPNTYTYNRNLDNKNTSHPMLPDSNMLKHCIPKQHPKCICSLTEISKLGFSPDLWFGFNKCCSENSNFPLSDMESTQKMGLVEIWMDPIRAHDLTCSWCPNHHFSIANVMARISSFPLQIWSLLKKWV